MFSFCSKGSPACLWSEMDQFCRVLQKGSVPIDKKWPLLILQLRDVADHPFLDDAQKARMHEILVELLQKKVFSDERYLQTVDSIHSVMQAPYEAKMLEISRETYNLLEDINRLVGLRHKEIVAAADLVEDDIAGGKDPAVVLAGVRNTLRDVAEKMEQDTVTLKDMSFRDSLTGLGNRHSFDTYLEAAIAAGKEHRERVCLIMFDIDHFKNFNDTYGHLVGDQVLRTLAGQVRKIVQPMEAAGKHVHAARYGGEEFAVLLRGSAARHAGRTAEQIRCSIENSSLLLRDAEGEVVESGLRVTVSVGVAEFWPGWKESPDLRLVDAADKALYHAKRNGRNKTVCFDPNSEPQYQIITEEV